MEKSVKENLFFLNKKAQSLNINAIIIIILAVVVLVILILGFSMGWSTIASKLSSQNIDTIKDACTTACSTRSTYGFCSMQRDLVDEKKNKVSASCYILSKIEKFTKYGIEACDISCSVPCSELAIDGKFGNTSASSGTYDVTSLAMGLEPGQSCWIA